jgi:hypothetical protein
MMRYTFGDIPNRSLNSWEKLDASRIPQRHRISLMGSSVVASRRHAVWSWYSRLYARRLIPSSSLATWDKCQRLTPSLLASALIESCGSSSRSRKTCATRQSPESRRTVRPSSSVFLSVRSFVAGVRARRAVTLFILYSRTSRIQRMFKDYLVVILPLMRESTKTFQPRFCESPSATQAVSRRVVGLG